jgi:hypothetical protein
LAGAFRYSILYRVQGMLWGEEDAGITRPGFLRRATAVSLEAMGARGVYEVLDELAGGRPGAWAAATVRRRQEQYLLENVEVILDSGVTVAIPPLQYSEQLFPRSLLPGSREARRMKSDFSYAQSRHEEAGREARRLMREHEDAEGVLPRQAVRLLMMLLALTSAALLVFLAVVAALRLNTYYRINHVSGSWMALTQYADVRGGIYPPLYDSGRQLYGGTRFMPEGDPRSPSLVGRPLRHLRKLLGRQQDQRLRQAARKFVRKASLWSPVTDGPYSLRRSNDSGLLRSAPCGIGCIHAYPYGG